MTTWTKDRSTGLSLICVWVFAAILLLADIFGFWGIRWYLSVRNMETTLLPRLLVFLYAASVFGWLCLWCLRSLLRNMKSGEVFTSDNVRLLRHISWCCAGAAIVFVFSTFLYIPLLIPAAAAAFMMLIVRVVKNAFQQACAMKDELDLTI